MQEAYFLIGSKLPHHWLRLIGFTIRCTWTGSFPEKKNSKLCVFASYEPSGDVPEYVRYFLRKLQANSFDIVLVTTSARLDEPTIIELQNYCRRIIHRRNVGYDFFSWKVGLILTEDVSRYEKVALINDSVFGPFCSLDSYLAKMDTDPSSLWGFCDSVETGRHHLQSWFLYFDRSHVASSVFETFWRAVTVISSKNEIVMKYEIGLSEAFKAAGSGIRAIFPYMEIRTAALKLGDRFQYHEQLAKVELNPTLKMWDILLRDFGFPFIKKELLTRNRYGANEIENWFILSRDLDDEILKHTRAYVVASQGEQIRAIK
ncbi:rhamnan synthesis F family protein [Methyloterricola oryzae]|uniref:rhamnan synthesis F family protein n=1 Tax=Methyloterricola oryzae TaxID=1495050 RepID=UPI002E1618FE